MAIFDIFRGRRERTSDIARDRLLKVLVDDRVKLTPETLDQLKAELSAVFARYVPGIDTTMIEVSLARGDAMDHIKTDVPVRRVLPQ